MITSSLADFKKAFGITDDEPIVVEEKGDELILRISLKRKYSSNDEIIQKACDLTHRRREVGWTRKDFFDDFMRVREQVINDLKAYYGKK